MNPTSGNLDETAAQVIAPGVVCPQCGARLVVTNLGPGTRLLCGGCGAASVLPAAPDLRRTSRMAILSVICGVVAVFATCVASVPAISLGLMALRDLRRSPRQLKGRGLALAGIWLGILLPLVCSPVHIAFILPAVQVLRNRESKKPDGDGPPMQRVDPASPETSFASPPEKK